MPAPLPEEAPVVEAPVEAAPAAPEVPAEPETAYEPTHVAAPVETPAETPAETAADVTLPEEIKEDGVDLENQSLESAMSNFDWDKYFESTFDSNGQVLKK